MIEYQKTAAAVEYTRYYTDRLCDICRQLLYEHRRGQRSRTKPRRELIQWQLRWSSAH